MKLLKFAVPVCAVVVVFSAPKPHPRLIPFWISFIGEIDVYEGFVFPSFLLEIALDGDFT